MLSAILTSRDLDTPLRIDWDTFVKHLVGLDTRSDDVRQLSGST